MSRGRLVIEFATKVEQLIFIIEYRNFKGYGYLHILIIEIKYKKL